VVILGEGGAGRAALGFVMFFLVSQNFPFLKTEKYDFNTYEKLL
jgi:hypothetical protein